MDHIRASPAVLSMWWPSKIFLKSKFSCLLIFNPTHKTETGTANTWGTTNSKPPALISMIGQSEKLNSSQIIFITLCLQVHSVAAPITSPSNCPMMLSQNYSPEPNRQMLTFLPLVYCAGWCTEHCWRCSS